MTVLGSTDGDFRVGYNPKLISAYVPKLKSVLGNLVIQSNPQLSLCSVQSIVENVLTVGGKITVTGNGEGCD